MPCTLAGSAYTPLARSARKVANLHERIATRFDDMLKGGLVEEVARLREEYVLESTMPSMRCVGYRQMWQYLAGECSYSDMTERGIAATRQLAKRQLTWLRGWQQLSWLESDAPLSENLQAILSSLS